MNELVIFFVVSIVLIVVLSQSLKIAGESERFAVFVLGRFQAYRGPGLIFVAPFTQQVHRLKVGDVGVLTGSDFARFGTVDVPVSDVGSLKQGQAVRIDRFDGAEPRLAESSMPAKTICPSCGHNF